MSDLASLETFCEKDPFFKKWRSCRHSLQSELALPAYYISLIPTPFCRNENQYNCRNVYFSMLPRAPTHPFLLQSICQKNNKMKEKKENENTVNILYQDVKCWLWLCPWNDSANSLALQTLRYSMKIRAAILQDTADMWYWFFLDRTTTSATKNTFWVSFFCDIGRKCFVFQSLSCSLCLLYYTRKKI